MEVQVPLVRVARWTRTALAEKMRAASNAHLISHLPVREMAKTAQELQAQVLPRRVKLAHFAVQEAELDIVVVVHVAHALPVITVMVGKMRVALNAHLINRIPVRAMAKTAQKLQAQVLPLRAEQDRLVVQAMVFFLPDFICKQVEFALRR